MRHAKPEAGDYKELGKEGRLANDGTASVERIGRGWQLIFVQKWVMAGKQRDL